jgi:hypothetical protein
MVKISLERPQALDEIVAMELENFSGSLRYGKKDLERLAKWREHLFVGARNKQHLVGYCSGARLPFVMLYSPIDIPRIGYIPENDTVYLENFVCSKAIQNSGIGTQMLKRFISEAAKEFRFIEAYFHDGSAYHLAKKLLPGIIIEKPYENYEGSGELYHLIVAPLATIQNSLRS